jgi:hypothetical protein
MAGATDFEPRATKSKSLHHSLKRGFALHKLDMQVNKEWFILLKEILVLT